MELRVEKTKSKGRKGEYFAGIRDIIVVGFLWGWFKFSSFRPYQLLCIGIASILMYFRCTRVLYESVVLLPLHGIQLETHRGLKLPFLPAFPLVANRRFIPLISVLDVVINEGLRRWDVRYYMCVIHNSGSKVALEVAFENILPCFPVLEATYNQVQDFLRQNTHTTPKAEASPTA